jgi:hypothetical protein
VPKLITQQFAPGPAWLHFLVLGALLHLGLQWLFPPPKPVLGPPSEARLQMLYDSYAQMAGDLPGPAQMEAFIDRELREELLFRKAIEAKLHLSDSAISQRLIRNILFLFPDEDLTPQQRVERGLALNMHLTDEVIRRRLVQMMSELLVAAARLPDPSEQELRAIFNDSRDAFWAPAMISFQQVFVGENSAEAAGALLARFRAKQNTPAEALVYGRPFLGGNRFSQVTFREVEGRFGRDFAEVLRSVAQGDGSGWLGVVTSVFGDHVIYLDSQTPERSLDFEEVVADLRWQLMQEREAKALDDALNRLFGQYEVIRS